LSARAWLLATIVVAAPVHASADARVEIGGCESLDRAVLTDLVHLETRAVQDPAAAFVVSCEATRIHLAAWCGLSVELDLATAENAERLVAIAAGELAEACLARPIERAQPERERPAEPVPHEEAPLATRFLFGAGYRAMGSPLAHAGAIGAGVELCPIEWLVFAAEVEGLYGAASTGDARVDLWMFGGGAHAELVLALARVRLAIGAGYRVLGGSVSGAPRASGDRGRSAWGVLAGPSAIGAIDVRVSDAFFLRAAIELVWIASSFRAVANDGTVLVDFAGPAVSARLAAGFEL
jgi:hypothetical protein